jgi:hypothetical protein
MSVEKLSICRFLQKDLDADFCPPMIDAESKMGGEVGFSNIISDQSVIKTSEDIIEFIQS